MSHLQITSHALSRMAQRNISMSDVDLIMQIGAEVDDGFLVREKECQLLEQQVKQFLNRVRRLKGKRIVVTDGCLVTAFHADRCEEKRLLRAVAE
jgi:hypothetical protein